jgi:hypothetical protein
MNQCENKNDECPRPQRRKEGTEDGLLLAVLMSEHVVGQPKEQRFLVASKVLGELSVC